MAGRALPRTIALIGALFFVVFGAWAFFAPRNFFETVAEWPPYNRHFLHDIGAFQIGIGAMLLAALRWGDSLLATLAGAAVGSTLHAVAHLIDREDGGRSSDPWTLGALAALLVVGAFAQWKADRP